MKRSTLATLLGLALVAAPAANAADSALSYSYIEANYVGTNADIDDGLDATAAFRAGHGPGRVQLRKVLRRPDRRPPWG